MMIVAMQDSYAILGVKEGASSEEIRKAYRSKALIWHPDKRPDDPLAAAQFQSLQKAYDALSDEQARKAYENQRIIRLEREKRVDSKRMKMMEDLTTCENPCKAQADDIASEHLKTEIAEIRATHKKKGKGMERMLRVSWLGGRDYCAVRLKDIFAQFGRVEAIQKAKRCSAFVVMSCRDEVLAATKHKYCCMDPFLVVVPLVKDGGFSSASPLMSQPLVSESSGVSMPNLGGNAFHKHENSVLQKMRKKAEQLKSA